MANIDVTPGTGKTVKTDTVSGSEYQVVKIDAGGAGVAIPIVAGRLADAVSLPVALSTEDVALVGALTETAPASDTASSGLNGRLQRIAQRITSLITALGSPFQAGGSIGNTTFASTIADAANVTFGAKADAKSTATDTTAITAMQVWKQISASVQLWLFGAGTAAGAGRVTLASDDPAVATLGAVADAAVTAGATGSLSAKLRSISRDIVSNIVLAAGTALIGKVGIDQTTPGTTNAVAPISGQAGVAAGAGAVSALTQRTTLASDDPAVAVLGTTSGAKVITDANGTIQQYLRGIITQWISSTLTFASQGYAARVSVTRPSDTTTYGAGDVVGVTGGGTATITFPNMGAGAGEYMITSARFQRNATALISGETSYILHLFNVTQPAAQIDNAVFDVAAGDQASYLGSINLGTPVDIGSTLAVEQNGINKQVTLASSSLFGVLVTVGGYQPVSAAVHIVELHSIKM